MPLKQPPPVRKFLSELRAGHPCTLIAHCAGQLPYGDLVLTQDSARFGGEGVAARWRCQNAHKGTEPFILDMDELAATLSLSVFTKFRIDKNHTTASIHPLTSD